MKFNIAVGGFHHETNTFSPAPTGYEEFLKADGWPGLLTGDEILNTLPALNLPLGGFLKAAHRHEIYPTTWANAEPYGLVTKNAFDQIAGSILDALPDNSALDAVYLDLHGAMVTSHSQDGEGTLLSMIRDKIGKDIPVVISLDFHANVTPDMFEHADAITIFRTYPHIDMADTGKRAFELLLHMLESGIRLHKAYRQIPYLIPLSSQHTESPPCDRWFSKLGNASKQLTNSVDIACGFPPADIYHCGPAIVAYGDSETEAESLATNFYELLLDSELDFKDQVLNGDEAVSVAVKNSQPGKTIVIADVQDNPGAGGSADTTGILKSLIEHAAQSAVVGSVFDPAAAAAAHRAGCGATIAIELGGHNGPQGVTPYKGEFIVEALSDGVFSCDGAMLGGINLALGPMALLKVANTAASVKVAVTSERFQCLDQGLFRELGIEPSTQMIVAVKSTVHFRADFDSIAAEILLAEFKGNHPCRLQVVPYKNLRLGLRLVPRDNPSPYQ